MASDAAIIRYLEQYGQPQTVSTIASVLDNPPGDLTAVRDQLEELANDKRIKRVKDGDDGSGAPIVSYAPLTFNPKG